MRRGRVGSWRLRTATRRSRTQWRLLVVVSAVAVLACTLVTALSLLVSATEQRAVRSALTSAPVADTVVTVHVTDLTAPAGEVRTAGDAAVTGMLAPAASATATGMAFSEINAVPRDGQASAIAYYGELDGVTAHARLIEGVWPASTRTGVTTDDDGTVRTVVPVAVPEPAVESFGLALGDLLPTGPFFGGDRYAAEVVGIYAPDGGPSDSDLADSDLADGLPYWTPDPLGGAGLDEAFAVPGSGGRVTTPAIGPLVLADGGLDAVGMRVERLTVRYVPDFTGVVVADVVPLIDALGTAEDDLPVGIGDVAGGVRHVTALGTTVQEVGTGVLVTRATVVVVSLLLIVLAVAALLQTARLLVGARTGEQHLMRARGASNRQLLGLAALEAAGLALVTAIVGANLARGVYVLVARGPAMAAAGMSGDPGLPTSAWATANGVAVVFGVVLVSPLLRRGSTFVEGEQAAARPSRRAAWQRSGLDLVLLLLAGVAYWQLRSYRSPFSGGASLSLDPVLVAGPALVLLAGALLCVRLIPAASRLAEGIGARGRGVVAPLASWQVGRRSHRATSAVLLLTLALSVGTFSQSFLSTWRQSQADQAAYTVGAPVRVTADTQPWGESRELSALLTPAAEPDRTTSPTGPTVAPVQRRTGTIARADRQRYDGADGPSVRVLGLGAQARGMLTAGRLAEAGGATIVRALDETVEAADGVALPGEPAGILATLRATAGFEEAGPGWDGSALGLAAIVRAVIADADGVMGTLDLGTVPLDGEDHEVQALFATDATGTTGSTVPVTGRRLVGIQVVLFVAAAGVSAPAMPLTVDLLATDLAVLSPAPETTTDPADPDTPAEPEPELEAEPEFVAEPVQVGDVDWYAVSRGLVPMSVTPPQQDQIAMRVVAERFDGPAVTLTGWSAVIDPPAVLTRDLARRVGVEVGDRVALLIDGAVTRVEVTGIVRRVPTTTGTAVVVDQELLARALAQSGVAGSAVDEWWIDPGDRVEEYLAALGPDRDVTSQPGLTGRLQHHPLRVATQGALLLVGLAAGALAAVGFAVHAAASLRAREVENAQLRAIGVSRNRLTAVVGVESVLLGVLGTLFGVGLGVLLGRLVGPLVAVSSDGSPPVPAVRVLLPWADVAGLAVVVVTVLATVVLAVGVLQRHADPAALLRRGEER